MKCKDMPKTPRMCEIILCAKCLNSGGTMVNINGVYQHPNCKQPVNRKMLEKIQEERQKAVEAS